MTATIADIAKRADVSLGTVSKVLNGRPGVGEAKRAQILRLIKETGYEGRSGRSRRPSRLIEFVMRGIDTLWATQLLVGAEAEAARGGVGLVISATHGRLIGNRHWIDRLSERHSDGVVVVASRIHSGIEAELGRLRIPHVMLDMAGAPPPGVAVVGATNAAGGRAAVDHLVELGHRKIGVVTGNRELACSQERLDGYIASLVRAGIEPHNDYIHFGNFDISGGYRAACLMLDSHDPPTAIFAGSDLQAFGVYQAARERGIRIPEDLSIVGFDDVPLCEWLMPRLTTIRQPLEEMAQQSVRMVMAMAYQQAERPQTKLELATTLVVRESTAPPRRRR
ncbi:MAG: LacI family DNA-binding transcriptional regulator [Propionibacteriaceae bacterium]|nr:LacI family DNA-binding transcriptional regulator [Propionibacteriaceae bacterium]